MVRNRGCRKGEEPYQQEVARGWGRPGLSHVVTLTQGARAHTHRACARRGHPGIQPATEPRFLFGAQLELAASGACVAFNNGGGLVLAIDEIERPDATRRLQRSAQPRAVHTTGGRRDFQSAVSASWSGERDHGRSVERAASEHPAPTVVRRRCSA